MPPYKSPESARAARVRFPPTAYLIPGSIPFIPFIIRASPPTMLQGGDAPL
jgi:hypothetical protein